MEYVFGNRNRRNGIIEDILKTKGEEHTNFYGKMEIKREFDDAIIIDTFNVINKYQSKKDQEGNCYDWYIISNHYRYIDKYTPNIGKVEEQFNTEIADTNAGLMETYDLVAVNADDIADCRSALEELYEMIEGV